MKTIAEQEESDSDTDIECLKGKNKNNLRSQLVIKVFVSCYCDH